MDKPIQVAVTHTRNANEQWGAETVYVLTQSGKLWRMDTIDPAGWLEVKGPWKDEMNVV